MPDPQQTTKQVAKCAVCGAKWSGPYAPIDAQAHANETGHPVWMITQVQAKVRPA
jgi:hypothetical protein